MDRENKTRSLITTKQVKKMGFLYGCDIFLFLRRVKEIDPVCLNQNPRTQNVSKKIKALLEKAF